MSETPEQITAIPETPAEETPPVATGSEETKPVEGTPAEPTPETEPSAAPDGTEKTPEQLKEDAAHWQTKHQESQAKLKAFEDGLAQPASLFEPEPSVEPDKPAPAVPTPADGQGDMDLAQLLKDQPELGIAAMADHLDQKAEERFNRAERQRQFKSDADDAERALRKFAVENEFSIEEYNTAVGEIRAMELSGNPKQIVKLMAGRMFENRSVGKNDQLSTAAAAKAAQAAKQQQLAVQPDGGTPAPVGPKSLDETVQSKFKPSKKRLELAKLSRGA